MNTKASNRFLAIAAGFVIVASARGADRWWDGTTTGGTGDGASAGGTATWDTTTLNWDQGLGLNRVAWNNAGYDNANFATSTVTLGATPLIAGGLTTSNTTSIIGTQSLTLATAATPTGAMPIIASNAALTIGNLATGTVLAGTEGIFKTGGNNLIFQGSAAQSFTGGIKVDYKGIIPTTSVAGRLEVDFSNFASNGSNLLNSANSLTLGSGNFSVKGKSAGGALSQAVNGLYLSGGMAGVIVNQNSSTSTALSLNAITRNNNAAVEFLVSGAGAGITTSSTNNSYGMLGPWAAYLNTNVYYATVSSGAIAQLAPTATVADPSALTNDPTGNYDVTSAVGTAPATVAANTIRLTTTTGTTTIPTGGSFTVNGLMTGKSSTTWTITGDPIFIGPDKELVLNAAASAMTVSSAIKDNPTGGASGLTIAGYNAVTLSANNSYTGPTTVNGIVSYGDSATTITVGLIKSSGSNCEFGAGSSVILNNAVVQVTGAATTCNRNFTLNGNSGIYAKNAALTISGTISGAGNLCIDSDFTVGSVVLSGNNDFTGDVKFVNDGRLTLNNVNAVKNATLDISGQRITPNLSTNNLAYNIGGLKGNAITLNLGTGGGTGGKISIGSNNQSNRFLGSLSGSAGLIKKGTGTQTFFKLAYTGDTIVEAGTLYLGSLGQTIFTGKAVTQDTNYGGGKPKFTVTAADLPNLAVGQTVKITGQPDNSIYAIDSSTPFVVLANALVNGTYAGSFEVMTGSLPATTTTVANTGTLAGAGTVNGALIVQAGGTVRPTLSGLTGTLTLASSTSPTFATGSTLKVRVPTTTTADMISLTNASAALACDNIDLVIDATGLTGNASNLTIAQTVNAAGITGTFHSVTVIPTGSYNATVHYNTQTVTVDLNVPVFHLSISSVNGGSNPYAASPFGVTVQALNDTNTPVNVVTDTSFSLSVSAGTGTLGGTVTGTITAGTNNVTISGVTYSKAENNVVLTATRTSGDTMDPGTSQSFSVINPPTTISMTSGNTQSASFGTALTNPMTVTVTDAGGNPVPGISVTFAIDSTPGGATGQVLSVTTATTNLSGQVSTVLTLGNLTGTYTVTATSGSLTNSPLTFTATATAFTGNIYWDGGTTDIGTNGNAASDGGSGTWDLAIRNWDTGTNPHAVWDNTGYAPATAVFAGTAGAVTLGTDDLAVGKLSFTGAYTLAGNGRNLTLNGTGTTINGGTLSGFNTITLGADQTWATTISGGAVDTNGHTLTLGTVATSLVGTTCTPVIGGTGNLALAGTSANISNNTANLNAANTFTGTITITGTGSLGDGVKTIVITSLKNAGTNSEFGTAATLTLNNAVIQTGSGSTSNRTLNITGNCGFYVKGGITQTLSGSIIGTGTLCSDGDFAGVLVPGGSGNLLLTGNNTFSGTMKLVDDGRVTLGNVFALTNATLDTSGTRTLADLATYNLAYVIGSLKGSGNLNLGTGLGGSGSGAVSFGNNNQSNSYTGVLSGAAGFTKIGTGTQTLSGLNTYTGNTHVNGGTLVIANGGGLKFVVTDSACNKVTGDGTGITTLNGKFTVDTTAVTVTAGAWTLVEIANANATFGSTFKVSDGTTDFTLDVDGVTWKLTSGYQNWTFSQTTGVLTLATAGHAYDTWALAKGLTSGNNAKDFDADGDGSINLVEFALGGDPLNPANNGIAYEKIQDVGGNQVLTLTIATRIGATFTTGVTNPNSMEATVDSTTYTIEGGSNLGSWTRIVYEKTDGAIPPPAPNATPPEGYEFHTFYLVDPVSSAPAEFIRVRVSG